MEQFFADLSLVSYLSIVLWVATDKLIYIKDDDTYHTLKNVGVLEFIDNDELKELFNEMLKEKVGI